MPTQCDGCRDGAAFDLPFSMAFQPIVNISTGGVFAHEALVRGPNGGGLVRFSAKSRKEIAMRSTSNVG